MSLTRVLEKLRGELRHTAHQHSMPSRERKDSGKDNLHAAIGNLRKVGRGSIALESTVASQIRARARWRCALFAVRLTVLASGGMGAGAARPNDDDDAP